MSLSRTAVIGNWSAFSPVSLSFETARIQVSAPVEYGMDWKVSTEAVYYWLSVAKELVLAFRHHISHCNWHKGKGSVGPFATGPFQNYKCEMFNPRDRVKTLSDAVLDSTQKVKKLSKTHSFVYED